MGDEKDDKNVSLLSSPDTSCFWEDECVDQMDYLKNNFHREKEKEDGNLSNMEMLCLEDTDTSLFDQLKGLNVEEENERETVFRRLFCLRFFFIKTNFFASCGREKNEQV